MEKAPVLSQHVAVSTLLSTSSNNTATVVIQAPVTYAAVQSSGVDVGMTFLAAAYGASCAFILPFAHQCNLTPHIQC